MAAVSRSLSTKRETDCGHNPMTSKALSQRMCGQTIELVLESAKMQSKEEDHGGITVLVTLRGRVLVLATNLLGGRKMMTRRGHAR